MAYPDRVERHCAVRADVQDTDAGASEQSGPILFVTGTIRSRFGADMPKSTRMTHNGDWVWRSDRDRHSASLIDLGVHWTGEWPICLGVSSRAFNEQIGIRKIALLARPRARNSEACAICTRRPSKSLHVVAQQSRDRHNESSKRHFEGGQWSRSWAITLYKGG